MNIEQINCFNTHLANTFEQYKPLNNFFSDSGFDTSKKYYTKSNSSTSSNFNSEIDDDCENSTDTYFTSETNASFDSKLNDKDFKNLSKKIQESSDSKNESKDLSSNFKQRKNHTLKKRTAANMRERKRMESINNAFKFLREHIPKSTHDKRISKVDTLKLAINYISYLNEIIITGRSPTENAAIRKNQAKSQKKVVQYYRDKNGTPLTKHLLSWSYENNPFQNGNIVLAKTWTPEDPRTKATNNLTIKKSMSSCDEDESSKNYSQCSTSNDTNSNISYNNTTECQNNFLFQNDNYTLQSNFIDSSTAFCYTSNIGIENNFLVKESAKNQSILNSNQLNKVINESNTDICLQENNQMTFNSTFNTQNFDNQTINSQQNYMNNTENEFTSSLSFTNSACSNENEPFIYSNYNNQSFNQTHNHNTYHHNIENIPSKVFQNDCSNQIICYNNIVQNSSALIYNVE